MILAATVILGAAGILLASQRNDSIESSMKKSYVYKTYLKDDAITIQATSDTTVTLTGTVSEWSHRSLAEETVAGLLPGVKHIRNNLTVKGEQPAENSDIWIGMKVKTMLMFHRNVSGLATDVDVKNGAVTLHGKASSEAQKELTAEYARDVDGVKSVKNDMVVETPGKTTVEKVGEFVDDASITAQVKVALLFHKSTSIIKTTVTTKDGVVTVGGRAKNGAEKDLVGKLVNDIKGVKALRNEMTIE
jgi:osmotically-inducible protein OsmY